MKAKKDSVQQFIDNFVKNTKNDAQQRMLAQLIQENNYSSILITEDEEIYLYDGDTELEEGECFKVISFGWYPDERNSNNFDFGLFMENGDFYLLDDLSDYEFNLAFDAIHNSFASC